jgi:hypothetical protein
MMDDSVVQQLRAYIKANYEPVSIPFPGTRQVIPSGVGHAPLGLTERMDLFLKDNHDAKTIFSSRLEELRVDKDMTPVQLYKAAWIDKRLYSKIIRRGNYHPSKNTVMMFGLALHLDADGMKDLLETVGFTLSKHVVSDVVIKFCLEYERYDLYEVNELLLEADQKVLCKEPRE